MEYSLTLFLVCAFWKGIITSLDSVLGIKTKLVIQIPGNRSWNNRMYETNQLHGNQKKKMLNFSKPFTKRKFTDSFLNKIIKIHNKSGNEPAKDIENSKGIL